MFLTVYIVTIVLSYQALEALPGVYSTLVTRTTATPLTWVVTFVSTDRMMGPLVADGHLLPGGNAAISVQVRSKVTVPVVDGLENVMCSALKFLTLPLSHSPSTSPLFLAIPLQTVLFLSYYNRNLRSPPDGPIRYSRRYLHGHTDRTSYRTGQYHLFTIRALPSGLPYSSYRRLLTGCIPGYKRRATR